MSTQVRAGECRPKYTGRPDLQAKYHGEIGMYPDVHSDLYPQKELSRRHDGLIPSFGRATPTMNTSRVDWAGFSVPRMVQHNASVDTQAGPVNLPSETPQMAYTPTESTLNFLTHSQGTRLQPLPGRFYQ